jgi:hypothetical protein
VVPGERDGVGDRFAALRDKVDVVGKAPVGEDEWGKVRL